MSGFLLLLLIAALPIQLGKFFFLPHSYVLGIPIDYRAATLYFSDLVIVSYFLVFLLENKKTLKEIFLQKRSYLLVVIIFNLYLLAATFLFSASKEASYFFNFKLLILGILPIFVSHNLKNEYILKNALMVLKISVAWQSVLIILQFINQGSLGIWFLGERALDTTTTQIAHSNFFGWQFLRPYGTFSHPNVAGAYLVLSLIMLAPPLSVIPDLIGNPDSRKFTLSLSKGKNDKTARVFKAFLPAATLLALLLTFSKSAIFILTIAAISTAQNPRRFFVYIIPAMVLGIVTLVQILGSQIASVSERLLLIQSALDISSLNPLFGIGSNNFILELSKLDLTSLSQTRLLQPVHNVFLLILAENGIIGLILFALILFIVARHVKGKIKTLLFAALLFYLSVDHFLWTLQQGQLIFWLVVAYIVSNPPLRRAK